MSERSTKTRRRAAIVTAAVVAGGIAVAVPLAGSSGGSGSTAPDEQMRPAGIYALSQEEIAYYAGFRAGQGDPLDIDAPWELSDAELAFLSRPSPASTGEAGR